MDERTALQLLADRLPKAGDDAAIVDGLVVTIDMLHEATDFPIGTTRYTAGWRSVGASLSDVAAMGADPTGAIAVYGAPTFDETELTPFVEGAVNVCEQVGTEYVGGDLDEHAEFTVTTTAVGRTHDPVLRSGASQGEAVCVTGTLGRSAAGFQYFQDGDHQRGNELFQFEPRVEAGRELAPYASAMMDSSDGLARSLHQLAEASECGFTIERPLPIDDAVGALADGDDDLLEMGVFFGEDFELVFTIPVADLDTVQQATSVPVTRIGTVTDEDVTLDGDPLPDRGYTHGE